MIIFVSQTESATSLKFSSEEPVHYSILTMVYR